MQVSFGPVVRNKLGQLLKNNNPTDRWVALDLAAPFRRLAARQKLSFKLDPP
jgi:hypothetical protein